MKTIINVVLVFFFFQCLAQKSEVQFLEYRNGNKIDFLVTNSSSFPQEVNLQITSSEGLRGNKKAIVKTIAPKDTLEFYSFSILGSYSYNYNINATPVIDIETVVHDLNVNFDDGIVVFFKPDCPRSLRTIAYLVDNNFEFKVLDVDENSDYRHLMQKIIAEKRRLPKKLVYPIVLVDGKPHFNFDIPQSFQNIFNNF